MISARASLRRGLLFLGLSVYFLPPALCAQPPVLRIEQVKVGFSAGAARETRYKSGAWAPIYVDVMAPKGLPPSSTVLNIDTSDSENVLNRYQVEVPALEEEQTTTVLGYVRPGNLGSDVVVTARGRGDRVYDSAKAPRISQNAMMPDSFLYLVAGSRLPRLKRSLVPPNQPNEQDEEVYDSGWRRFGYLDRVEQMPTRWFGYEGVDLLVLTTGKETFIKGLVEEQNQCKEALAEWVRRGGRLVLCVGHNHQWVNQLLAKTKLLDCEVKGSIQRRHLDLQPWVSEDNPPLPEPGIEVALLQPGKGAEVLVSKRDFPVDGEERKVDDRDRPLIVQAPCGLGRVILVAFDLDQAPFTGWNGQKKFYEKLQSEMEPRTRGAANDMNKPGWQGGQHGAELAGGLLRGLESFEDIPVVSFGWVALFIFIYILIVGPLDYLFLKKVVKRLELTWITFPVVVLVVSTLAYFTAYYLKGNDLKINKIDLVDIDLHPPADGRAPVPQVYGTSWFTLFSPRIQNYTIGVEPAAPGWVSPQAGNNPFSVMVGWMGRPDDEWGGSGRSGGQGLFKRTYSYAPDAAGLEGVPIQVWAMKTFAASWEAPMPAEPLISARLRHPPGDPESVAGTLTSRLPVELQDVVLLYRDNVYSLGTLTPGTPKLVERVGQGAAGRQLGQWYQDPLPDLLPQPQLPKQRPNAPPSAFDFSVPALMKSILFHHARNEGVVQGNSGLRHLDQSWRVGPKRSDEVVLFGRTTPQPSADSEQVTEDAVTATRLWLGKLPKPGESRPELAGTLSQRTYVRIFIPVAPKE